MSLIVAAALALYAGLLVGEVLEDRRRGDNC
jgi:hypothetical protein